MTDVIDAMRKGADAHLNDAVAMLSGLVRIMEKVESDALEEKTDTPLVFMVCPCLIAVESSLDACRGLVERMGSKASGFGKPCCRTDCKERAVRI